METKNSQSEKIAFCITCMNRLNHIRQTLEKNILENYKQGKVEFVLLDYNSQDGLEEWVNSNMKKYIDEGILVYYRTTEPTHYLRSHSRNMAFRLANATILCNLDADNFLGKGFATFILEKFSTYTNIFYANSFAPEGAFGRICMRNEDFMSVRGYNESLKGWGFEDNDIQNRLMEKGVKLMSLNNPEYNYYIEHSDLERVSDEYIYKKLYKMYITYINPYMSGILLLYNDYTTEQYEIINNVHLNHLIEYSTVDKPLLDERKRVVIQGEVIRGAWKEDTDLICISENGTKYFFYRETSSFEINNRTYYFVHGDTVISKIIVHITSSINYNEGIKQMKSESGINADGFGRGVVYKNFNLSKKIILS